MESKNNDDDWEITPEVIDFLKSDKGLAILRELAGEGPENDKEVVTVSDFFPNESKFSEDSANGASTDSTADSKEKESSVSDIEKKQNIMDTDSNKKDYTEERIFDYKKFPLISDADKSTPNKVLFVSLFEAWPFWSGGSRVVYKYDILNDITYELGSELAFMVRDLDVGDVRALITSFKDANIDGYKAIIAEINDKIIPALLEEEISEVIKFTFSDDYVDWLSYHSNSVYAKIGEKLRSRNSEVTLLLQDIYEDYIEGAVLKDLKKIFETENTIIKFSIVNTKGDTARIIKDTKQIAGSREYMPFDGNWIPAELGLMLLYGNGAKQDNAEAFKYFLIAADRGNLFAGNQVGWQYQNGTGVEKDPKKAFEWYERIAAKGYIWAQANLGYCYHVGFGTDVDYKKAVEWYEKLIPQGFASPVNGADWVYRNLGDIYYEGKLGEPDYVKAESCYEYAAKLGNHYAEYKLGIINYENLAGGFWSANQTRALDYLTKAADSGNKDAMKICAELVAKGVGEPDEKPNLRKALSFLWKMDSDGQEASKYLLSLPYNEENTHLLFEELGNVWKEKPVCGYYLAKFIWEHLDDLQTSNRALKELCSKLNFRGCTVEECACNLIIEMAENSISVVKDAATLKHKAKDLIAKRKAEEAAEEEKRKAEQKAKYQAELEEKLRIEREKAAEWEKKRQEAAQKNAEAFKFYSDINLAIDIFNGKKGAKISQIPSLLIEPARRRVPIAMAYLGFMGIAYDSNNHKAFELVADSIKGSDTDFYYRLSEYYSLHVSYGVKKIFEIDEMTKALRANHNVHGDCYALLGLCYFSGLGVSVNQQKAVEYFKTGNRMGSGLAAVYLGNCYQQGICVVNDQSEAMRLYSKAMKQDLGSAYNFYANIQLERAGDKGGHIPGNIQENYEKAAKLGNAMGMINYAICLYRRDKKAAAENWLKQAISASCGEKQAIDLASKFLREMGSIVPTYVPENVPPIYFDEGGPTLTRPANYHDETFSQLRDEGQHSNSSVDKTTQSSQQNESSDEDFDDGFVKDKVKGLFKKMFGKKN